MRNTYQRAFSNASHVVDIAFNLSRIHVVTTADDQVFATSNDHNITALIDLANISGFEKPICSEFFFGLFGHAPVARENIGAFDLYATNFTNR